MILRGESRPDLLLRETLPEILLSTAAKFPQNIAAKFGDTFLDYATLASQSGRLGSALSAVGAAPNQVIGLLLPRGLDLLVAQAGISLSGAAWLPFDAEVPIERAATCLKAANALGIVSTRRWADRLQSLTAPVWFVEDLLAEEALRRPLCAPSPEHPAYVIYTSGSTGTPKGISVTHRNICHFLRSENALLGITRSDRVYQGFSAAFDMSFEEIWISFLVGATLWVAPPEVVSDPDLIAESLEQNDITILHAVPTLAALIERFPTTLRLINLGGEACSDALAQRLCAGPWRVFNTYGPTETTVTATICELLPGKSVTIGKPLPNYGVLILSPEKEPLAAGQIGEIAVFGPGVSLGYLNEPQMTAARFIPHPAPCDPEDTIVYLTGDLGKVEESGEIHYLGRADNQVKLRGFRIELDEIAAVLSRVPGISTAAAVVRPLHGNDEIVAFAVASAPAILRTNLRQLLRDSLPEYMVPARIEVLEAMPRLASGKINADALRRVPLSKEIELATGLAPHTPNGPAETVLWSSISTLFPDRGFRREYDFFNDLGGHSLLAARLVTLLRREPAYAHVGVQLIYRARTLGEIAEGLTQISRTPPPPRLEPSLKDAPPLFRRLICGGAQALCLPPIILLQLLQWLAPFFTYHYFTGSSGDSTIFAITASVGIYVLSMGLAFPIAIIARRILVGRIHPGKYPLWGFTYFRWWLGERITSICPVHLISGTPWLVLYLRCLGAQIGKRVLLNSLTVSVPELLSIGDDVSTGTFVNFENARVARGVLHVGAITIGAQACIDSYAVLENDTTIGAGGHLCGQSSLSEGRRIPERETWSGAPAMPTTRTQDVWEPAPRPRLLKQIALMLFYLLGASLVAILFFIPTFPAFILIDWLDVHTLDLFESSWTWWQTFPLFLGMSVPASMTLVLLTMVIAGVLRRILPRQVAGRFPVSSWTYFSKWLLSTVFDTSLQVLHGLYASVFVGVWLRLMGAKVGSGSEVSTAEGIIPDLLVLGRDSFIADGAMLGDEEQHDGWVRLQGTRIGDRSFVGNGAYVPDGALFPNDVLLGVQSAAPSNASLASHQTWMGSPAILLPARETVDIPDASLTFRPSFTRRLLRGAIEAFRIVLPMSFIISAGYVIVYKAMALAEDENWRGCYQTLLLSSLLYSLVGFFLVVLLKWTLVGTYRPKKAPMWTLFVWLSEAVTVAYESLAVPSLLDALKGTPMLPWALRLLGTKVGKGVWINTTDLTEFDCVQIGDFAELNAHSGPQTHLFEDRIMRIGKVEIGESSTIGVRSTVLYDASVGAHCILGPLTLVAKGEHLPKNTSWEGSPASPKSESGSK